MCVATVLAYLFYIIFNSPSLTCTSSRCSDVYQIGFLTISTLLRGILILPWKSHIYCIFFEVVEWHLCYWNATRVIKTELSSQELSHTARLFIVLFLLKSSEIVNDKNKKVEGCL